MVYISSSSFQAPTQGWQGDPLVLGTYCFFGVQDHILLADPGEARGCSTYTSVLIHSLIHSLIL